ncbi:MAG: hypothetical protein KBG92_11840 [Spirochaetes bacterium]|jgi:hypothetical protein|nr:hypothetical protein [Spirochaetota bacterium]
MKQSKFVNRTSELHALEKLYHQQGLHSGSKLIFPNRRWIEREQPDNVLKKLRIILRIMFL